MATARRRPVWNIDQAREWRQHYENGATVRHLAAAAKISHGTMHTALTAAGTRFRSRGGRADREAARRWNFDDDTIASICRDYEEGMGTRGLSAKYGPSRIVVTQVLMRAGVALRPSRPPPLSEDEIRRVRISYRNGDSISHLRREFRRSLVTINEALGIPRRDRRRSPGAS